MSPQESIGWAEKANQVFSELFDAKKHTKTWRKYKLCLDLAHIIELAK